MGPGLQNISVAIPVLLFLNYFRGESDPKLMKKAGASATTAPTHRRRQQRRQSRLG